MKFVADAGEDDVTHKLPHHRNGLQKWLIGVATGVAVFIVVGGVIMYADVQKIKGNRFTVADALQGEIRMRDEFNGALSGTEIRLRAEWLEGLDRIEAKIDQLRVYHMQANGGRR